MRHIFMTAIALVAALYVSGCTTMPASRGGRTDEFELRLTGSGQLLFDGKALPADQVGKRLRAAGATPDSSIVVEIPADVPRERVTAITGQLLSSGFRKVMLKRPRRTEVTVTPAPSSTVSPVAQP
jgi:hypothetical protein